MRHFATFSSFVVSFFVFCLPLHVPAGRGICGFSSSLVVPGLLMGVWLWFSLVPMGCLVKEGRPPFPVLRDGCLCEVKSVRCFLSPCGVPCVKSCQIFVFVLPTQCFLLWWSGVFFQATVGCEGAGLPPRQYLAATAELGLPCVRK